MIEILLLLVVLSIIAFTLLTQPKFGRSPRGERLEKIKKSPNYKNRFFQNLIPTALFPEGRTVFFAVFLRRALARRLKPVGIMPSTKTDLLTLDGNKDILVWFGHSSYFIQIDGKRILVDPVFSGTASPFSFSIKAFEGTDRYMVDDMPDIDFLFITHDHWDHLDYETVLKLKPKVKKIICGLGVGEHLEYWGYEKDAVVEMDWNDKISFNDGFAVYAVPARHFSGRSPRRNKTLWAAFIIQSPTIKIFIGGDSGYGTHFSDIGKNFGPFDIVILEDGQYEKAWKHIHMIPEEVLRAAQDLQAKRLFPVHNSKFSLASHAWDDPLNKITDLNSKDGNQVLLTPIIGEEVNIKDGPRRFSEWWRGII